MVKSEFLSPSEVLQAYAPDMFCNIHLLQYSLDVVYLHTSETLPGLPLQLHRREMTAILSHFFHSSAQHTLNLTPRVDIVGLGDAVSSPASNRPYHKFALPTVPLTYLQASELLGLRGWLLTLKPRSQSLFLLGKTVFGQLLVLTRG